MLLRKRSDGLFEKPPLSRDTLHDPCAAASGTGLLPYSNGRLLKRRSTATAVVATAGPASSGASSPSPSALELLLERERGRESGGGCGPDRGGLLPQASEQPSRGLPEGRSASVGMLGGGSATSAPPAARQSSAPASRSRGPRDAIALQSNDIVIHVCDEAKRVRRNFTCKQDVLLAHMKYFEVHLAGSAKHEDFEISVHCDVNVFEWLVAYMEDQRKAESLDENTVVSILISSEFLQMAPLVDRCLEYMRKSINQVVRLPFDLRCMSNELVRRLATGFTDDELDLVRDKRDRLLSRLFAHKLEELLSDAENELHLCVYCRALFTARQRECTVCPKADVFIDFHGNAIAKHVADESWDVSRYVRYCHEQLQLSWRAIYWRLWGRVQTLHCSTCTRYFCGAELEHCSYHPAAPSWHEAPRVHTGVYPCCMQTAVRFGTSIDTTGCCAREHVVAPSSPAGAGILDKLLRHRSLVVVPFADRHCDQYAAEVVPPPACASRCNSRLPVGASRGEEEDDDDDGRSSEGGRLLFVDEEDDGDDAWESTGAMTKSRSGGAVGEGGFRRTPSSLSHTTSVGSEHRSYCFDPLPEHYLPHPHAPARGRVVRREGVRRRSKSAQRTSRPPSSTPGRRGGNHGASASSSVRRGEWPIPAPAGSPSFFTIPLPPNCSENKQRAFRLDMLKEDDRRRMDMLVDRLKAHHVVASSQPAAVDAAPRGSGKSRLAWVGDAAAASAPGKASSPRRRSQDPGGNVAAAAALASSNGDGNAANAGTGSSTGASRPRGTSKAAASSTARIASASGRRLRTERGNVKHS